MSKQSHRSSSQNFLEELDAVIDRYSMLKHPFYQCWSRGELSRGALVEYAKQYYAHVEAFPTYLSAVHSRCQDMPVRQMLLENLVEEEQGKENHPELWLRFAEGLGVSREEVKSSELLPETVETVDTFRKLTQNENFVEGVAALYAYESQIPEVARTKREGLVKFYGINDSRAVSYFSVHEEADVEHSQVEGDILARHCQSDLARKRVLESAEASAKAIWKFLDGLYARYVENRN